VLAATLPQGLTPPVLTRCSFRKSLPSLASGHGWGLRSSSKDENVCFA